MMANVYTNQAIVVIGQQTRRLYHILFTSGAEGYRTYCGRTAGTMSLVSGCRPSEPFEYFTRVCKSCTRAAQASGLAREETTP